MRAACNRFQRRTAIRVLIVGFVAVGGSGACRTHGDWMLSSISPTPSRDARVLAAISLSPDGRYAVTETERGRPMTTLGRYEWNGAELRLIEDEDGTRTFPFRMNADGTLVMRYDTPEPFVLTFEPLR